MVELSPQSSDRTSDVAYRVRSLGDAWRSGVRLCAGGPALSVDGETLTYRELDERARSVAAAIQQIDPTGSPVAVLAQRSLDAYLGVLGAVLAGRTYVPLHPDFPVQRSAGMLRRSGAGTVVVGPEADEAAQALFAAVDRPAALVFPSRNAPVWASRAAAGRSIAGADLPSPGEAQPESTRDDSIGYLLFTSGSTGEPKGVGVTQANVAAYLTHVVNAYGYGPGDRCSQMFDLTFDLSVHDLFVTWMSGACLCVPSKRSVLAPGAYIRNENLSAWFSVPSVAMVMDRLRMLKAGAFPGLRLSLFCGEALSAGIAEKWSTASPNSAVHNLYGPTEATIAITAFEWAPGAVATGVVPIGRPFPGHDVAVVDASGVDVGESGRGELCLAGPQVTPGYWEDAERTGASFVELPGSTQRWYRTGDVVERSEHQGLRYLGRIDDQIQIMGFRVELVEIDAALRQALGTELAVAVSYPPGPSAEGVYAFAVGSDHHGDEAAALGLCRDRLPSYMVPKRVFFVEGLPLNSNGKVDRGALRPVLEELLGV